MNRNMIETVMGAVVLIVAVGVLIFAYENSSKKPTEGYSISANFESATGIAEGSDVRVGGIKVGTVADMQLDPKTYQAVLTMQIRSAVTLPDDSSAAIVSDGLLGSKFIAIEPGGSDTILAQGGKISFTQPSVSLETLIGKFMFSGGGVDGDPKKPASAGAVQYTPGDATAHPADDTVPRL